VPRFALVLGVLGLGCSLSVVAFFVGVPLGLLSVLLSLAALRGAAAGSRERRGALRALVVGGLGLCAGLLVWFVHVRAVQTAYRIPDRRELVADFERNLADATAPLPGASPRVPQPVPHKDATP
jgi:hypothetical protein